MTIVTTWLRVFIYFILCLSSCQLFSATIYDLVLANGRVIDPESGLDAIRHVGIGEGKILAVSDSPLMGNKVVDVTGLVVAPGFIDLHAHGQDNFSNGLQARDGVTTALEMEIGVYPVSNWYESRAGNARINYGATVSHMNARVKLKHGIELNYENGGASRNKIPARPAAWADEAASEEELEKLEYMLDEGLSQGALGIGFGIAYTPAARREEIWRCFKVAASRGLPVFTHVRSSGYIEPGSTFEAIQEVIANAATSGAALQIVHIGSTGREQVPEILDMVKGARRRGLDISMEVYPWTAAQTAIGSAIFDGDWRARVGSDFKDIEWVATGERLTQKSFERYRKESPKGSVIAHVIPEEMVEMAIADPDVMIASDGPRYKNGKGHPRGAGTFARVLGRYVRERKVISLMDAIRKMTIMPAERLQEFVPQMLVKGRIQPGADADITVFDPVTIIDRATYQSPVQASTGIMHVLVAGKFVVQDTSLIPDIFPGTPIRRLANIDK